MSSIGSSSLGRAAGARVLAHTAARVLAHTAARVLAHTAARA
jgi:hypothetical protein